MKALGGDGVGSTVSSTADVPDSLNRRYCTDAQKTVIGNTSGTNTGDQTTVSGNAGTATTLQTSRTINGVSFNGSANITVPTLLNSTGSSSGDVAAKMGSSVADGSVHAAAEIARVSTGIGGTEVPKLRLFSNGGNAVSIRGGDSTAPSSAAYAANTNDLFLSQGQYRFLTLGSTNGARLYGGSDNKQVGFDSSGNFYARTEDKEFCLTGTDSSGSPGAATINKANGISAIANGATTVKITNNLAGTAKAVQVTILGDAGATARAAGWWVTRQSDGFTLNFGAAVNADTPFFWELRNVF